MKLCNSEGQILMVTLKDDIGQEIALEVLREVAEELHKGEISQEDLVARRDAILAARMEAVQPATRVSMADRLLESE